MAFINTISGNDSPNKMVVLISLIVGGIIGASIQHLVSVGGLKRDLGPTRGLVTRLENTPVRNTVHIDELGRPITKQQLLEPFVLPNFVGFSVATFKPGQTMMPVHEHESMHEIFYVIEGTGIIQVNGIDHKVSPGTFLHIAPHEKHGIWIPKESKGGDMKMVVCGVTVGDNQ
uniref:Cupin type-2 domain-containing protein n=1 Tax=Odontella aurita TaxID=265563 RepID=A0A7S4JAN4_9STRA|mmetsp:Transcript_4253/g.11804  ORF Transcript_4253/g.11804 Transcript_4253/m.11804 type:complete len:173 (+) Transcript_4253:216-734(+)